MTALALPYPHLPAHATGIATAPALVPDPVADLAEGTSSPPGMASLRARLQAVVAGGRAAGSPWPTGIAPLDAAMGGGIPRGRITEMVGALASGKTALLRQVVARVLRTGGWVAWIDAGRTLAPAPFAGLGDRLVMVRPRDSRRSAWCADLLLRSGVFALVVLDGAPPLSRVHGVRLAQLARERDAACVVLTTTDAPPSRVSGAIRLRLEPCAHRHPQADARTAPPRSARRRGAPPSAAPPSAAPPYGAPPGVHEAAGTPRDGTPRDGTPRDGTPRDGTPRDGTPRLGATAVALRGFAVIVEKGGPSRNVRSIEVNSDIVMARRVCTDSEIPDRRGVARGTRRPWAAVGGSPDGVVNAPVTWGGLGVSAGDDIHTPATPSPHRDATRAGLRRTEHAPAHGAERGSGTPAYVPPLTPREREHERTRFHREFDKHTRDWTRSRGRRRMAESSFGKPSLRERVHERGRARGRERHREKVGSA